MSEVCYEPVHLVSTDELLPVYALDKLKSVQADIFNQIADSDIQMQKLSQENFDL